MFYWSSCNCFSWRKIYCSSSIYFGFLPNLRGYENLKLISEINNKVGAKKIKPGKKLLVTQVYTLEKEIYEKEKDNMYMYLGEKLYPNEIKEKFYEGIRYRKALKV